MIGAGKKKVRSGPTPVGKASAFESGPGIWPKKGSHFLKEPHEGWFAFHQHVVLAFKRNKAGARDARGQPPTRFEGHPGVVPGVHHKGRHPDLREK